MIKRMICLIILINPALSTIAAANTSIYNSILKPHGNLHAKDFDLVKFTVNNVEHLIAFGWQFSTNSLVGYYVNGVGEMDLNNQIIINFPESNKTRWAPSVTVKKNSLGNNILFMYYARGENQKLGGKQIYVASANLSELSEVQYNNNRISSIFFPKETRLKLMDFYGNFAGRIFDPANENAAGIIDPEIFCDDDGKIYLYYVVVLPGISGVACHQEFIRVQLMNDFETAAGQQYDLPIVDGFCDAENDGVVESPSVVKVNGKYKLIFSSYPSSWIYPAGANASSGQYVKLVDLASPTNFGSNERALFAKKNQFLTNGSLIEPEYELDNTISQYGFGGQDIVDLGKGHFKLIGQGLHNVSGQEAAREYGIFTNDIEISIYLNIH